MASMDKIKSHDLLHTWTKTNNNNGYVISAKLDGVSALYYHGSLFTRGDGLLLGMGCYYRIVKRRVMFVPIYFVP
jgi:NAD-dependent DNA ligase